MANITDLSPEQLRKAANLKEQIEKLQKELGSILGGNETANGKVSVGKRKRGMSAEARAKISAAATARWAKVKGTKAKAPAPTSAKKVKRPMSAAAKAKLGAKMKEIWAKRKAAKAK
jgi:hypothetical protein